MNATKDSLPSDDELEKQLQDRIADFITRYDREPDCCIMHPAEPAGPRLAQIYKLQPEYDPYCPRGQIFPAAYEFFRDAQLHRFESLMREISQLTAYARDGRLK